MEELTEFEKAVYNCYLKNLRDGQPFMPRKEFSTLSQSVVTDLKKVSNLLAKNPFIKIDEYFGAVRKIFPNEKYPNLSYFYNRPAIKYYNMWLEERQFMPPDGQIENIKEGFRFISRYCIDNGILIEEYISHKSGVCPTFLLHHKINKINLYCFLEIGDVLSELHAMQPDEKSLYEVEKISDNIVKLKKDMMANGFKVKLLAISDKFSDFVRKHLKSS